MGFELPVIWTYRGVTRTGRIELLGGHVTLTSRHDRVSFDADDVETFAIERAPAQRLRGLPVLSIHLDGEVLRIASMGGAGSLHELAARIGTLHPTASGT